MSRVRSSARTEEEANALLESATSSGKSGRAKGCRNYSSKSLMDAMDSVRPVGPEQWKLVAQKYQELSGEEKEREIDGLKKHWKGKCILNMQPVTGRGADDLVVRCQAIEKDILSARGGSVIVVSRRTMGKEEEEDEDETMANFDILADEIPAEPEVDENLARPTKTLSSVEILPTQILTSSSAEMPPPPSKPRAEKIPLASTNSVPSMTGKRKAEEAIQGKTKNSKPSVAFQNSQRVSMSKSVSTAANAMETKATQQPFMMMFSMFMQQQQHANEMRQREADRAQREQMQMMRMLMQAYSNNGSTRSTRFVPQVDESSATEDEDYFDENF